MKPIFSVRYLTGNVAPATVEFTDDYYDPNSRITLLDFGDGRVFTWNYNDQTKVEHTYTKAGKFAAKVWHYDEMSDVTFVEIVALPAPIPSNSLWGMFIAWLKKLFGMK